ncbi:hypothetical protein [Candidatus Mycoplasma haematominutum]|uniref:Uncharacterized protein n=1 Tax=Candidatus Mycoplasma haematominutum 'Birmingham 1' TaxID=1116213 RepID=G8C2L1_9MOLU|nr:hypothetical protein [Candidatus Mycoplasma haematominutum]CCE66559.1 hypothetical protein (homolog to MSU_0074) [Candidatus Mycoplasma haematominutum 'Birmingham 1']
MLRQEPAPKLSSWALNSLYLQEQEWIQKVIAQDAHKSYTTPPKPERFSRLFYHPQEEINWYEPNILSELSVAAPGSIYKEVFQSKLQAPYLWFFLGQYVDNTSQLHIGDKLKLHRKMMEQTASTLIHFPGCKEYSLLLDKHELHFELKKRLLEFEKESTISSLKQLNLTDVCENISKKLETVIYPEKKQTIAQVKLPAEKLKQEEKLSELLRIPVQRDWMKELPIPLQNSLPSMFLHRCFSPEVPKSAPQRELHPTPQFIQNLSKMVMRFSILRHYTPEEVERMVRENTDWTTAKSDIQWHDPQEKWFYWDLPAINLFFDRFREDFRHTIVTDWEEPEKRLSLSKAEIGEAFEFSHAEHAPIFRYEGIPEMTIGEDLNKMEELMNQYSVFYKEQVKKELETEGAPPSVSWQSEAVLQELEKAKEELP